MNSPEAPCRKVVVTAELTNCFDKAAKAADHKLSQKYTQILLVLNPEEQKQFRTAQSLWVQFRDATCEAEEDLYKDGSAASGVYLACIEEQIRIRTEDLQTIYGWRLEKFSK